MRGGGDDQGEHEHEAATERGQAGEDGAACGDGLGGLCGDHEGDADGGWGEELGVGGGLTEEEVEEDMAGLELGVLAAVAHVQNVNAEVAPSRIVDQVAL